MFCHSVFEIEWILLFLTLHVVIWCMVYLQTLIVLVRQVVLVIVVASTKPLQIIIALIIKLKLVFKQVPPHTVHCLLVDFDRGEGGPIL